MASKSTPPNPFSWIERTPPKKEGKVKTAAKTQSLENKMDLILTKLEEMEKKLESLDSLREISEKVDKLGLEVERCKRELIASNIIIVGVDDKEQEPYAELENKVVEVFKSLKIGDIDYSNIRRLGKYTQGKKRSVQVKLVRQKDKVRILKAKPALRQQDVHRNVYINPELTEMQKHQEYKLRETAKIWKSATKELKYFIRGGRLIVTRGDETRTYGLNEDGLVEEIQNRENMDIK